MNEERKHLDIPPEIWLYISRFIPVEELCHLFSVNSVFFELAMDLRWKEVAIVTRHTREAMHILSRLSDPFIANRLNSLTLRLTHVKQRNRIGSHENAKDLKNLRQQFYINVNRVFRLFRSDKLPTDSLIDQIDNATSSTSSNRLARPWPTFEHIIDAIADSTPHFKNVQELTIDSWDLPPFYDLKKLLETFWKHFGHNLRFLSLGGNLDGYRSLVATNPSLIRLESLEIEFTNNLFNPDQDDSILTIDLIPFVNDLSPRLKVLRVWSWANLDLSAFFRHLAVPPRLECLNIRMAFNKALTNPLGLQNLLKGCSSTLQKVDLRLNPSWQPTNPELEEPLSQWLLDLISSDQKCLSQLCSLDIYPTTMDRGVEALLITIQRASKSLVQITVRDRYFRYEELARVIDAAATCENLVNLRFNISRFDIAVLDLLAAKVPKLRTLWISVGEPIGSGEHGSRSFFLQGLKKRSYINWKLQDLSIWEGGQEVDTETMLTIAHSISSVTSFFGREYIIYDRLESINLRE